MPGKFRVYYDIGAGEVEITNVLGVSCTVGRKAPLDAYRANTATVDIRYPSGYASPNAAYVSGTEIRITTDVNGAERQVFRGQIADVEITYGKPYYSSTGPEDILQLTCESYFATLGRAQGNNYVVAADTLGDQLTDVANEFNVLLSPVSGFGNATAFSAATISGTVADWLNIATLTMNGRLHDAGPSVGIVVFNQYYKAANVYGDFSDDGTSTNTYTEITFDSLADNYYTQIVVDGDALAPISVQDGSPPYRTYQVNTYNATLAQAIDYGNYLLSTYKVPQLAISSIRVFLDGQTGNPTFGCTDIGTKIGVKFRGTTYNCIIEGATFTGSPTTGIYATYYVSGADLNNYLLLNDAVYGRLDFNKLGY